MTYLDYQATTPLAPEALAAMLPWLQDQHGNPHSPHRAGRMARAGVEVARDAVAALLPRGGRLAFTGGATEAINWAIKGSKGGIVTLATEHAAVLDSVAAEAARGRDVTILPVDAAGLVDMAAARAAIRPGVGLVAAMLVNNEIGVVQPIAELAALARAVGARMLCDAVQGYGRVDIPDGVDWIALSAHKIYGPKGIGGLWMQGEAPATLLHGGDQEGGRSGTLSPALCAGFGAAATLMRERAGDDAAHIERLWQAAHTILSPARGWMLNGDAERRYHGNINVRRPGLDVARLMSDCRAIAFSAGSACASGSGRSSHVLRAIGLSEAEARASIRIGFGRDTSEAALVAALERIVDAAAAQ